MPLYIALNGVHRGSYHWSPLGLNTVLMLPMAACVLINTWFILYYLAHVLPVSQISEFNLCLELVNLTKFLPCRIKCE